MRPKYLNQICPAPRGWELHGEPVQGEEIYYEARWAQVWPAENGGWLYSYRGGGPVKVQHPIDGFARYPRDLYGEEGMVTITRAIEGGPDTYDLREGSIILLEGATMNEIAHFLMHGHGDCDPHPCPNLR